MPVLDRLDMRRQEAERPLGAGRVDDHVDPPEERVEAGSSTRAASTPRTCGVKRSTPGFMRARNSGNTERMPRRATGSTAASRVRVVSDGMKLTLTTGRAAWTRVSTSWRRFARVT